MVENVSLVTIWSFNLMITWTPYVYGGYSQFTLWLELVIHIFSFKLAFMTLACNLIMQTKAKEFI